VTAWQLASVPFWMVGMFWLLCAAVAAPYRRKGETDTELGLQIITGLVLSGLFFAIAAWMSTTGRFA
jgi:hypothetical protein